MGIEKRFTGPARLASWAPNMDVVALVSAEGCVASAHAGRALLLCTYRFADAAAVLCAVS